MINRFGCIGIGLSLTVLTISGLSLNASKNFSTAITLIPEKSENCSLTSVKICRSQMTDTHTGTVISVSNLKRH